jgi:hypothetical protein
MNFSVREKLYARLLQTGHLRPSNVTFHGCGNSSSLKLICSTHSSVPFQMCKSYFFPLLLLCSFSSTHTLCYNALGIDYIYSLYELKV